MVKVVTFDMNNTSRRASTPVWVQAREYTDDPAALHPPLPRNKSPRVHWLEGCLVPGLHALANLPLPGVEPLSFSLPSACCTKDDNI